MHNIKYVLPHRRAVRWYPNLIERARLYPLKSPRHRKGHYVIYPIIRFKHRTLELKQSIEICHDFLERHELDRNTSAVGLIELKFRRDPEGVTTASTNDQGRAATD